MSRIRSKNTRLENDFCRALSARLYKKGRRYRKHYAKLAGKPDIVFIKQRVAVFLDGDFWHGRDFEKQKSRLPKKYWLAKIKRNIERDKQVGKELKKSGWRVLRFWEHDIKKNSAKIIARIGEILQKR